MRKSFPGYYRPTDEELKILWKEAIFVLDTNVLLNLYSYPEAVREVFFSVLKKISARIWIPYQVGIEFHRNKFSRIKQSNQKVSKLVHTIQSTSNQLNEEVKNIELEKRNIGLIDIQERLEAVKQAHSKLSEAVQLACDKLPPISLEDPIGEGISKLLENRVGPPPNDQTVLDEFISGGEDRYSKEIPPGYLDAKEKGDTTFRDRNITYLRKFGDLILWKQLLAYAKESNIKHVVFVTGDRKKDWWWIDDGKTLGPLPDLVQEITLDAGVDLFWMYTADQFLEFAEKYLKATEVTKETIEQVKEISSSDLSNSFLTESTGGLAALSDSQRDFMDIIANYATIGRSTSGNYRGLLDIPTESYISYDPEQAVINWLEELYSHENVDGGQGFPDIVVNAGNRLNGYEVQLLKNSDKLIFPPRIIQALLRGFLEVSVGRLNQFAMVIIIPEYEYAHLNIDEWLSEANRKVRSLLKKYPVDTFIIGRVPVDKFTPLLIINQDK